MTVPLLAGVVTVAGVRGDDGIGADGKTLRSCTLAVPERQRDCRAAGDGRAIRSEAHRALSALADQRDVIVAVMVTCWPLVEGLGELVTVVVREHPGLPPA